MEIFRCGLHVFAAGFLAMTLTLTYAGNVTKKAGQEVKSTRYGKREGNVTHKNTLKELITNGIVLENGTTASPASTLQMNSTPTPLTVVKGRKKVATDNRFITVTSDENYDPDEYDDEGDDDDDDKDAGGGLLLAVLENPEDDSYSTETIPFRKCCAKDQSFNAGLKCVNRNGSLKGVDIAEDDVVGHTYPWFPTLIISGSKVVEQAKSSILNVNRINVQYGSMPQCEETERLVLQWYKEESSFFFIFASNGTIVELNHRSMETIAMWSVDSFCMDSVPSNEYSYYVALLCPCLHKTCVRKCCPRGFYYNESSNACNEFTNFTTDYSPTFFTGRLPLQESVSHYVLRRMPVCGGNKIEYLYSPKDSLYIQQNGSLLIQEENGRWGLVNNSRYCADYFLDEYSDEKVTNVLFCIHKSDRFQQLFSTGIIRVRQRSDGDFFTVNFFLFLAVLAFVVIYE